MELFELTKSLVNMASVTGHEKACAEFVKGYLHQLGFQTEMMPVGRDRSNVLATLCLLYTSPSPRDPKTSRMPSSA